MVKLFSRALCERKRRLVTDGPSAAYFWGERISNTDKNELATLPRVMTLCVMWCVTLCAGHAICGHYAL